MSAYVHLFLHFTQGISFLDVILVAVLVFYAFEGFSVGFVTSVLDSFSFLTALIIGFIGYKALGGVFESLGLMKVLALPIAFLLIALVVEGGFRLLRFWLGIPLDRLRYIIPSSLRFINQLLGLVFGVFTGSVLLMSILAALVILPISPVFKQALQNSSVSQYFLAEAQGLEGTLSQIGGKTPTDLMTFFTIEPTEQSSVALGFTVPEPLVDEVSQNQMFQALNAQRTENGVPLLVQDEQLTQVAQAHAQDMLIRGYFAHNTPEGKTPFDRMSEAGITYQNAGENLALSQSVDLAMNGLMHSPGHRANILSDKFHKVGIGVLDAGWYGKMFVQEFTD